MAKYNGTKNYKQAYMAIIEILKELNWWDRLFNSNRILRHWETTIFNETPICPYCNIKMERIDDKVNLYWLCDCKTNFK